MKSGVQPCASDIPIWKIKLNEVLTFHLEISQALILVKEECVIDVSPVSPVLCFIISHQLLQKEAHKKRV